MPDIDADSYLDERDPELELPAHPETPVTPELLDRLASIVGAECVFVDEPMSEHTTFEIGGPADVYVVPDTCDRTRVVIETVRAAGVPLAGEPVTTEECAELIGALRNGIEQGIRDSEKARKLASFTRKGRMKFRKFDKTLSGGHQHFCILCDSLKEDIPERIRAQMKSLSGRGDHVYAIVKGERTRLELMDGVNYCMTDTGAPKGMQTTPFRESPAFLRVVRNLKQSFGVNMVTTPIQELLSYTVGCFSPEHLFTTGDADKTESAIRLRKSGIQYGPYITLRKGIYEVVYLGNHLQKIDDYHVTSDAGKRVIHHNLTEKTDHTVRYSFSIDEETTNIEFAASNQQEEPVEITGIELKQFRG